MLVAMARDIRVLLVKLADRLDNMRTLQHMKPDAQERIATETIEIYAPLAGRLGIHWLKAELEDLSFKHLYPDAARELASAVKKAARDSERYITDVDKRLHKMLIERGFAVEVEGRTKHLYSIWRKMRRQNIEFEQVHDFVAFRVLMESVSDCYAALGVMHSQWTPIPGRFKDYIALPKPNMYQSLHTTVIGPGHRRIEVQIRTHEMHKTAEYGIAAHWKYKERTGGPRREGRGEASHGSGSSMEFQQELADPAEFLESVKVDLFLDEVYVFTPKGDVKVVPARRDARRLRVRHPLGGRRALRGRARERRDRPAALPAPQRRRRRDPDEPATSTPTRTGSSSSRPSRARSRIRGHVRAEER